MSIKKQRAALKVLNDHLARRGFKHNLEGGVDEHGFLLKEPGSRNVMASHALLRSIWRHAMDSAEAAKMELGKVIFSLYSENTAKQGLMPSFQNGVDHHNFYLDSDVDVQIFSKDDTPIPRFFTSVVFRGNILQKVLKDHVPPEIRTLLSHPGIVIAFPTTVQTSIGVQVLWRPLGSVHEKYFTIDQKYMDNLGKKPKDIRVTTARI